MKNQLHDKLYHTSLHLSRRKWKLKTYFYRLPAEVMEEYGTTAACVYAVLLNACEEDEFRADLKIATIMKKCKLTKKPLLQRLISL